MTCHVKKRCCSLRERQSSLGFYGLAGFMEGEMVNKGIYHRETKATRLANRDGNFMRAYMANRHVKREMVRARPRKVKPQYCFGLTLMGLEKVLEIQKACTHSWELQTSFELATWRCSSCRAVKLTSVEETDWNVKKAFMREAWVR